MMKNTILIAEDDFKIRQMVTLFLKGNNFEVIQAADGEEALDLFYEHNKDIDLILLDVMMPRMDGFSVLKTIRKEYVTPIIMLTAMDQEYDQIKGFENGADDYVSKPFSPTILLARIQSVLRRANKNNQSEIIAGNIVINKEDRTVIHNGKLLNFKEEEFNLLLYFINNAKKVLEREKIFNEVWNQKAENYSELVDKSVKSIREKLEEDKSYIKIVHGAGYIFEVE
ncbi:MAG: response regulator transcription factor [Clostridium sp.]|jgi:DNA-binding response OmpR family regulator|nr:response regulator transcription factor [Clostridium sp.]